jgi:hypothetical protein
VLEFCKLNKLLVLKLELKSSEPDNEGLNLPLLSCDVGKCGADMVCGE